MTVADYMKKVEAGDWPEDPRLPIRDAESFLSEAGSISNILHDIPIGSVTLIHSVAGSTRSNHYHKTDWHFIYVAKGEMIYVYRPNGSKLEPRRLVVDEGGIIFTPPRVAHATFFTKATDLVTFNNRTRDKRSHEEDVVRLEVPLLSGKVCGRRPADTWFDKAANLFGRDERPRCIEPAEHVDWQNHAGARWMHVAPHGELFR